MTWPVRGSRLRTSVSKVRRVAPSIDSAARQTAASATTTRRRWAHESSRETGEITGPGSNRARDSHPAMYVTLQPLPMHVLLLRPVPGNDRFGLGPFFRIEPLGMEYIAAALEARGHAVTLADLRFSRSLEHQLRVAGPGLVGIAAMHALETDEVLALARRVRALAPGVPIVVGGHTAAAYPVPFLDGCVDAVVLDDGERAVPRIADALARGGRSVTCPVSRSAIGPAKWSPTAVDVETFVLDDVPLPARRHVAPWRRQYACLAHRPTWLIETARGCPFRCSFCSIWQLHNRSVRERSIESVCRGLRERRRSHLRGRRSVLVSPVAKPRAGAASCGAAASARNGCSCRAGSTWWRGTRICSRRGARSRGSSTSSSGSRRRPTRGSTG